MCRADRNDPSLGRPIANVRAYVVDSALMLMPIGVSILEEEGVSPAAWIWVHAYGERDRMRHVEAARRGAWVEFDGLNPVRSDLYVALILNMKEHDVLHRVLVSHDAGWYHVGEPDGGTFRPYDTLFTTLIPGLKNAGFTDAEIHQIIVKNPAEAFAVRVRAR